MSHDLSRYRSYPYPVPGPWSYNPQYPAGYAGPEPIFVRNDDGTLTQVMGVPLPKSNKWLWACVAVFAVFLGLGLRR